jgi:hypothetical protein
MNKGDSIKFSYKGKEGSGTILVKLKTTLAVKLTSNFFYNGKQHLEGQTIVLYNNLIQLL